MSGERLLLARHQIFISLFGGIKNTLALASAPDVSPPLSVAFLMPISRTGRLSTATTRVPLHLYFNSIVCA